MARASQSKRLVQGSALRVLNVAELRVDPNYQRDVKSGWKKIVDEFDQEAFGIPVVGEREDGSLYIVDGQQRIFALSKMGRKTVRAEVFRSEGVEHEAKVFKKINLDRKRLNPREEFRSLLAAHDKAAWEIKNAVESVGKFRIVLGRSGNTSDENAAWQLGATNTLLGLHKTERVGVEGIKFALRVISESWPGDRLGTNVILLDAIGRFYGLYKGAADEKRLIERLQKTTPHKFLYTAGQMTVGNDRRSAALALLDKLYHKRLQRKPIDRNDR